MYAPPPPYYASVGNKSNPRISDDRVRGSHRSKYGPNYDRQASIMIRETTPLRGCNCNHPSHNRQSYAARLRDTFCAISALLFVVVLILAVICGVMYILNYLNGELPEPHPYWDVPTADRHCYSYGTREYTARLLNISSAYDRMEWCMKTPVMVRGVSIDQPNFCETRYGNVYGHWLVDFEEYQCLPNWGNFKDEGCTVRGSGFRRYSSRLWNIARGESWHNMCASAPAEINHIFFRAPTFCVHKGIFGMYGIWEVEDDRC